MPVKPETGLRVAFLTNLIPPYHKPLFALLQSHCEYFRLFISTPMEANRPWLPEWKGLDVIVQKGISLRRMWHHPRGFDEAVAIHFPTDTLQQLSRFNPNAVITVEMGFRTFLACLWTTTHPSCRLIVWSEVTDRTEQGRGRSRQMLRRFIARRAHCFIAVGSGGVRYIQSLGVAGQNIYQLAYSTNLEPFLAIPLERQPPSSHRLLFSGQLIERKGLQPFLQVVKRWAIAHPEQRLEFHLLGDGPARQALADISLPDSVKLLFIGTLQYNQLPAVYADSGIFVLPTLADTWAVVVNEALASGLPVLGSIYSQAVEEMVQDGNNGWTFCPDEPEQMYAALNRALSLSASELNLMRVSARASALKVTPENAASVCLQALQAGI